MKNLKWLREQRELSQVKLAARADLNPATVNQIERGMRDASPGTLRKLADALGVSLYELMEEEEAPKVQAPLPFDVPQRERREQSPETRTLTEFLRTVKRWSLELVRSEDIPNPGKVAKEIDRLNEDLFMHGFDLYHSRRMQGDLQGSLADLKDAMEASAASTLEAYAIAAARDPKNIDNDAVAKRRERHQQQNEDLRRAAAG